MFPGYIRLQNYTCKATYSNWSVIGVQDWEAKYACDKDLDCYAIHDETCSTISNLSLCHKSKVEHGRKGGPGEPCIYRKSSISNKG